MIDLKKQIESIIEDLANDAPISRILLKAQTIAFYIKDDSFTNWIKNEQNGYSTINDLPEYRKAKWLSRLTVILEASVLLLMMLLHFPLMHMTPYTILITTGTDKMQPTIWIILMSKDAASGSF